MNDIILDAKGLSKTYRTGPDEVVVWENVDLKVNIGETISK